MKNSKKQEKNPMAILHLQAIKLVNRYVKLETIYDKCKCLSDGQQVYEMAKRIFNRRKKPADGLKHLLTEFIRLRLEKIARAMPEEDYSMGGSIKVILLTKKNTRVNGAVGVYDNTSSYSRSCGYKAKHGGYSIRITLGELLRTKIINRTVTYLYPIKGDCLGWWYDSSGKRQHFKLIKKLTISFFQTLVCSYINIRFTFTEIFSRII